MTSRSKTFKRFGAVLGVLIVSALVIVVLGGSVPYTVVIYDDGTTTMEGAFISHVPASSEDVFSIIEILSYWLGLGSSRALLLACSAFGLSLVAGLLLLFSSSLGRSSHRPLRCLVIAAYCATPLLAAAVVFMFLYAVVSRTSTVA